MQDAARNRVFRHSGRLAALLLAGAAAACTTAGSTWMAQPLTSNDESSVELASASSGTEGKGVAGKGFAREPRVISEGPIDETPEERQARTQRPTKLEGRVLGSFRNTYYDFPNEADYQGETVTLKDGACKTIKDVPRGFYEAVCVQGSGTISTGATVSFAKRDCECAPVCPRTSQHICFEQLDAKRFPWGRGATGQAITPLITVAVDSEVIPLNTPVYIPQFDGLPRDLGQTAFHDGCFIAQDRGLRVKGKHVDVFTGDEALTKVWNGLVPSNKGVTVVLDNPRCARATVAQP
jgi:3D (Asp-Asp-Asp) domain-containing protein